MKKEARDTALKMFLRAKGKITNKQISDAVQVNPLTVGRWKRNDQWEQKLLEAKSAAKAGAPVIRKKEARDKALKLFMDSGGTITNKEMSRRVGVSPATIAKWKELDKWSKMVTPAAKVEQAPPEPKEAPAMDMSELAAPEQIIRINSRIESLLQREYLTAEEIAELAAAKRDMLDAVEIYVAIACDLGMIKH